MNDTLLTLDEIAALYRVSYRFARDRITRRPDFPKPIPGCTRRKPLWLRQSVEDYISRKDYAQAA